MFQVFSSSNRDSVPNVLPSEYLTSNTDVKLSQPKKKQYFFSNQHSKYINLENELNAITISPNGELLAVASKEVKIISSKENKFRVDKTLRSTNHASRVVSEVKWHPNQMHSHYICSASKNGKVILWNLNLNGKARKENTMEDHFRSVNKLSWHPNEPLILTASMDGDVRLWDIKTSNSSIAFSNSVCCRDVSFNPYNHWQFAAVYEDGTILLWDRRKGRKGRVDTINAHSELILSLDWHPVQSGYLATGSRDKTIKVWNLNQHGQAKHTIQTSTAVNNIRWRGSKYPSQIASTCNVRDHRIHLWDINYPKIPLAQVIGHKETVTGFIWDKEYENHILSCSKDGTIQINHVDHAYHPYKHLCTNGLAWDKYNNLAVFYDEINRNIGPNKPITNEFNINNGSISIYNQTNTIDTFIYFAKNYKLRDESNKVVNLCQYNAKIAENIKEYTTANLWITLAMWFENKKKKKKKI